MYTPMLKIPLTIDMEAIHFCIVERRFISLRTKVVCISGVQVNDLGPMKNCPGGCKVDQISPRCEMHVFVYVCITGWVG